MNVKVHDGSATPPTPGKETIYIDVEDEITSIIDKVENSKQKIAALVLPKRSSSLQSIVNMRLLKRSADRAGKNIVLITSEPALLPLAGAAELHVAKTLQSKPEIPPSPVSSPALSEAVPIVDADEIADDEEVDDSNAKIDYNRSIGELATAHDEAEDDVIDIGDEDELPTPVTPKSSAPKKEKSSRMKVPNFEKFRLLLIGGIALALALIIFIFLAIFVLPKATIAITTTSSPITANLTLNASDKYTELNEAANQIPASLKASDQTSQQTVNATGQQNQGDKATGTIKFYNCNSSDTLAGTNHTVPAGTGVSANGLTYITQQSVVVEPSHFIGGVCQNDKQSSSVDVKAQNGGTKYNQAATTYSVSGFSTISGAGSKMSNGTDNNVTVVSQADLDGAKAKVTSQSSDDYSKKFLQQLDDSGFYVLKSSLKINDPEVTASPAVGQPASSTNVSIKIHYTVLVVKKDDLRKVIQDTLNEQIDKKKQKIKDSDVLKDASVNVQNQTGDSTATLVVSEDTLAIPIINESSVKTLAAGKKAGDIKGPIGNWPGVKNVDVKMSPFWVSKAPKNTNKITVKLLQVSQ